MPTSFGYVWDVFERVYQQVSADKGLERLESEEYVCIAPSREHLALFDVVEPEILDRLAVSVTGPKDSDPVAWVLDPKGLGLVQINDGVSENELLSLAGKFYGYDL